MNCFYHSDQNAIGFCKVCTKGLCRECASDLEVALACRGKHEEQARRISQAQLRAGVEGSMLPLILVAMGLLFVSWGVLSQPFSLFTTIFGVGLVVLAMAFMIRGRASFAKSK
jgi:hypothetical protein